MRKVACLLVFFWLFNSLAAPRACAENLGPGGGTRVIAGDQVFGPYQLYITSAPEPAQIGTVTFAVRVSDAASGDKVRDAEVTVELVNGETGAVAAGIATHDDAGNPIDYAAHIALEQAGAWNGVVRVRGAAGAAEVQFLQRVTKPRQIGTLIGVGLPFVAILVVLAVLGLARARGRRGETA